jgi:hypothetical protein
MAMGATQCFLDQGAEEPFQPSEVLLVGAAGLRALHLLMVHAEGYAYGFPEEVSHLHVSRNKP